MLTGRKDLARTSKKPGKTQMINYFLINENWFLVDLPGYGYAKVSKKQRKSWHEMIEGYLAKRPQLYNIFNLIDPNVEPQERDLAFINWMGQQGLPFSIVFTKMDKKGKDQRLENIEAFKNRLLEDWEELPPMFYTSSQERSGREEILSYIQAINAEVID